MKALIVEDEQIASKRLATLIAEVAPHIEICEVIHSVESGKKYLDSNALPDLIFLDIQLNDGYGFDILDHIEKHPPIIFTTAYNEYAIRGFKYNSIDYLLKPIDKKDLARALSKLEDFPYVPKESSENNLESFKNIFQKEYKHRFMVKVGNHFSTFNVEDICYFKSHDGMIWLCNTVGKEFPIEYSLDQLEEILNPIDFFRINRKYIVALKSVNEIHNYFNSRLLLKLQPRTEEQIIVSRNRTSDFKRWLDM